MIMAIWILAMRHGVTDATRIVGAYWTRDAAITAASTHANRLLSFSDFKVRQETGRAPYFQRELASGAAYFIEAVAIAEYTGEIEDTIRKEHGE